jgi:conjugal transfer pilus assembly protein TraE
MNPNTLMQDLKQMRSTVRLQGAAIELLGACLLSSLVLMFNMVGRDRVIVTPPSIDKTFWVSKDRVSSSYLEQMGSFIAYLTLDVSPQSIDWKKTMLLQYVSPDVYGVLQTRQDLEADRLRRLNATTQFSVAQLLPNEEAMNVTLKGRLATFINGTRTSDIDKEYVAEFEFKGNRVQIRNFKEIGNGESATKVSAANAGVGAAD